MIEWLKKFLKKNKTQMSRTSDVLIDKNSFFFSLFLKIYAIDFLKNQIIKDLFKLFGYFLKHHQDRTQILLLFDGKYCMNQDSFLKIYSAFLEFFCSYFIMKFFEPRIISQQIFSCSDIYLLYFLYLIFFFRVFNWLKSLSLFSVSFFCNFDQISLNPLKFSS